MKPNPFQKLRTSAGLTQAQAGDAIGCSTARISAWERAISSPRPDLWKKIAQVYGVNQVAITNAVVENAVSQEKSKTLAA